MTQQTAARPSYKLKATVLQDGHVDRITGPRCVAKMAEGPNVGRYVIVRTDAVLTEGTQIIVDTITQRAAIAAADGEALDPK